MADQRYRKVRVKATGEIGYIAHVHGAEHQVNTHLSEWSLPAVSVLMDTTGEVRTYLKAVIEDVTD